MPASTEKEKPRRKDKPDICKFTCIGTDREELEAIKKLLGVHKDQTAIRIAIHGYLLAIKNVYSGSLVIPHSFRAEEEEEIEKYKKLEREEREDT